MGKGEQFSDAFTLLFTFLAYVIPIFGAWLAESKIGRYKAIAIGVFICGISHVIMIIGAIPSVLKAGHGAGPFILSLLLLAIGAGISPKVKYLFIWEYFLLTYFSTLGIFKPNITPTVVDQYTYQKRYTKVLKSGEKVVVDPEATIQRIMLIFYGLVNIGAFYAIGTTYAEKRIGYWLAYLVGGIIYFLLPILLVVMHKRTVKYPPEESVLPKFFKVLLVSVRYGGVKIWRKGYWDSAKPSVMASKGITSWAGKPIDWDDKFVDDVHRTIDACKIFLYFVIYSMNDGGLGNVQTNQGGAMTTNGAPNDLISNFNPLVIMVTIPTLTYVVYPTLNKWGIKFGRINRIIFGFILAALSGAIGAIIQWRIYKTSPCGYQASDCSIGSGVSPLNVWYQVIFVALAAISECFANVTAYEMSYARAPPKMRALVMSIFLFMNALSSAFGEILTPVTTDPHLIWIWAAPAVALGVQTIIFWFRYRHLNNDEFMTYQEDYDENEQVDQIDGRDEVTVEKS